MPIKSVILDRDGTLYNQKTGLLQPGVPEMLERLTNLGLAIFVVSNESREKQVEERIGLPGDHFLYHSECGNKGSKRYVEAVLERSGFERHELVYLGDSEQDMWEASTNRLALFNAEWSNPNYEYGLAMKSPSNFVDHLEAYFLKKHPWFFKVTGDDALGRPILFRALLDPDTCKNQGITRLLKERREDFKDNEEDYRLAEHLVLHLIGSFYCEGLHLIRAPRSGGFKKPLWCLYPGKDGGKSPILRLFERFTARLLAMTYSEGLLSRHTDSTSSHRTRMAGGDPPIEEQFNTVQVSPGIVRNVRGNVVVVVDDFSTGSNAMETARNLLYAAGAKQVIGLVVGKYKQTYTAQTPTGQNILPRAGGPATVVKGNFTARGMPTQIDREACRQF